MVVLMGNLFISMFDPFNRVSNASSELEDDYKMAVEVAVGSAIIVALAMLVALIWKT